MYWDVECDDVTVLPSLGEDSHFRFPKMCFDKIIEVPFENTMLPILEDYDLICRSLYGGSYMIPIKKENHDYLKSQIEQLRRYFAGIGEVMPTEFDMTFE